MIPIDLIGQEIIVGSRVAFARTAVGMLTGEVVKVLPKTVVISHKEAGVQGRYHTVKETKRLHCDVVVLDWICFCRG